MSSTVRALNWKEVGLSVLEQALATGHSYPLSREEMPSWARDLAVVTGAWLYYHGGDPVDSTGNLSTGRIHAHLDVERQHSQDPQFRYDRYLLIRVADGRVFQAGPFKDVEYGHHRDSRPDWLGRYCSESTG